MKIYCSRCNCELDYDHPPFTVYVPYGNSIILCAKCYRKALKIIRKLLFKEGKIHDNQRTHKRRAGKYI